MKRLVAPSLPPYPKLMFDPLTRRALVTAWHPTWQSVEWAKHLTQLIVWIAVGLLSWTLWLYLSPMEIAYRILTMIIVISLSFPIAANLIRQSLLGFLARRIFPTKTKIWFTPKAIAFKSRLYPNPVVIWRKWHGQSVRIRFILQPDRNAQIYTSQLRGMQKRTSTDHLEESQLLEIVLTTSDKQRESDFQGQETLLRTIPVTEINCRLATRFTMVYAAAATLTAAVQNQSNTMSIDGKDIDAI